MSLFAFLKQVILHNNLIYILQISAHLEIVVFCAANFKLNL